ncbi:hypothetical protein diail_7419 [Diaporthe ilicicola]|nr:hypothetical protein diail_7419 [Diaporthe ilicicola]
MASNSSSDDIMSIHIKMEELEVSNSKSSDSTFGDRMVTFSVGPKDVKFVVHEQVISHYMSAFQAVLNNIMPCTASINLSNVEPETFKLFVEWAYLAKIGCFDLDYLLDRKSVPSFDYVKLYAFAQEFDVKALQDTAISVIYFRIHNDNEVWGTLGSENGMLEYLVSRVNPDAHMYTLVTRALAFQMLPAGVLQQEARVSSDEEVWTNDGGWGDWDAPLKGGSPGFAFPQTLANPAVEAGWDGPADGANMGAILDTLPATLLRSTLKEFFRMNSLEKILLNKAFADTILPSSRNSTLDTKDESPKTKALSTDIMSPNKVAQFSDNIITISVGPKKDKFSIHENVLIAMTAFFQTLIALGCPGAPSGSVDLPDEEPKTVLIFVNWLYAAHLGVKDFTPLLPTHLTPLFKLYAFAHKFVAAGLQDAIVRHLYAKFSTDKELWFTVCSDKFVLETFFKVVPSDTPLYKFVTRSIAYSTRPIYEPELWINLDSRCGGPTNRTTALNVNSRATKVMESMPQEHWGTIMKEILLAKAHSIYRSFDEIVGHETSFLVTDHNTGRAAPSTHQW